MKTAFVFICLVIACASCDTPRRTYSPSAHNVPVFTKQWDSKIAASYSTTGPTGTYDDYDNRYDKNAAHGLDVQGALAVSNHIALQGAYSYRYESSNATSDYNYMNSRVKCNRNLFEFGVGFFTALDKKEHMLFQLYTGAGFGKSMIDENGSDQNQFNFSRYYDANVTKYYIEPSITFRPNKVFSGTIATRWSIIQFGNITTDYTYDEKISYNLDSLDRFAVSFFEPAFVGTFGLPHLPGVRAEIQVGLGVMLQESFITYRPFNFSVGMAFDIGKLINGGKKNED